MFVLLRVYTLSRKTFVPKRCLAMKGGIHLPETLPCNGMRDEHADLYTNEKDLRSTPLI
jgi:hypothetical protein